MNSDKILEILGGKNFIKWTGAKMVLRTEDSLTFTIKRHIRKVKWVKIILEGTTNLYTMQFFENRKGTPVVIAQYTAVPADQMRVQFTAATWMDIQ